MRVSNFRSRRLAHDIAQDVCEYPEFLKLKERAPEVAILTNMPRLCLRRPYDIAERRGEFRPGLRYVIRMGFRRETFHLRMAAAPNGVVLRRSTQKPPLD